MMHLWATWYSLLWLLASACCFQASAFIYVSSTQPECFDGLIKFLHITKTGGTAIDHSVYGDYLEVNGHSRTMQDIFNEKASENKVIAVVREPIDRFLSIYKYWKYGSDLFNRNNCEEFLHAKKLCTKSEAFYSDDEENNREVMEISDGYGKRTSTEGGMLQLLEDWGKKWPWYMWEDHFRPQTYWLNDTGSNQKQVVLVRYTSNRDEFSSRVHAAMEHFGVCNLRHGKIPIRNVSVKGKHDTQESIPSEIITWLREEAFPSDFDMWDEIEEQANTKAGPWGYVF